MSCSRRATNGSSVESWTYEPKLDGFRGLLWHRSAAVAELLSRNGRDLGPWFPELVQAGRTLPPCTLIDGEIIIADSNGHVDFGALQAQLSMARAHVLRTAVERPAVLIVFDILQLERCDLRPFSRWSKAWWQSELMRGTRLVGGASGSK